MQGGLARLDHGHRLEALVLRAEPAGEEGDGRGLLEEEDLAGEEVLEVDELGVVGDDVVGLLLVGQADGDAEAGGAAGPALAGAHDAVAGAGDDHPAALAHAPGEGYGLDVVGVVGGRAARAEDRDLADAVVRGEDLEGVAQLLEGIGQELEVAAAGAVAGETR